MATQTKAKTKWSIEADYFQACNCDYGCPCEFEAPPTMGYCEGAGAWKITKGRYGTVSLDGLALGFLAKWPGAIHQGNGTAIMLVDAKANKAQREALLQIASGQAGGMPFEILPMTLSKVLDPQFVNFSFKVNGKKATVKMGNVGLIETEPIKNPVNGEIESVEVNHRTGFIFKKAEVVAGKTCQSTVDALPFSYPNKAGFIAKVKYKN